jgi:hypothetical protein
MTLSGIKPATFRLGVQYLHQMRHRSTHSGIYREVKDWRKKALEQKKIQDLHNLQSSPNIREPRKS